MGAIAKTEKKWYLNYDMTIGVYIFFKTGGHIQNNVVELSSFTLYAVKIALMIIESYFY